MGTTVFSTAVNCVLFLLIARGVCNGEYEVGNYSLYTGALTSIFSGVLMENEGLWALGDTGVGLMAWFNIIAILLMCKQVKAIMVDFEEQSKKGLDPCFDPAEFGIEDSTGAWDRYAAQKK